MCEQELTELAAASAQFEAMKQLVVPAAVGCALGMSSELVDKIVLTAATDGGAAVLTVPESIYECAKGAFAAVGIDVMATVGSHIITVHRD